MSESSLVQYRNFTKNYSRRTAPISKITIHHAAGVGTAQSIVESFIPASRKASANYCVGNDGSIGQSVLECHRSWTSNSSWNDNQAITIEVSNCENKAPWRISDAAYRSLINLCVDICIRNNIKAVNYTGTKSGVLTEHRMFAATICPGDTIHQMLVSGQIAKDINERLKHPQEQSRIYEGVDLSPVFNAEYYRARYPDLAAAGLSSDDQLWIHFTMCGIMEARQASDAFDPVRYRNTQPDLNAAFGEDWEAYYKHYCMCGKEEIESGQRKEFM